MDIPWGALCFGEPFRPFRRSLTIAAPIILLVNPAAGGGRGASRAGHVHQALAATGPVERIDTTGPGDETRIARLAAERGVRSLVVVGGDGSVSRAARGLVEMSSDVPLAVFSAGTGNDFAKSLGMPTQNIAVMAARVAAGATRAIDVGFVDDVSFVNAAGFGFDVHVLQLMQERGARSLLRGTSAYVVTALRAIASYGGVRAAVSKSDSLAAPESTASTMQKQLLLVFANGRYFGGAFHIAPTAALDSGEIDAVVIRDASPLRRLSLFAHAMRGTHLAATEVESARSERFCLSFESPPRFEADGEVHQARSREVVVSVRKAALRVVG